jgi:hypothetical protein
MHGYLALLHQPHPTPEEFLKDTLAPGLLRNRQRLPLQVLDVLPVAGLSNAEPKPL